MNQHIYEGNGPVCTKAGCYQVQNHECHIASKSAPLSVTDMFMSISSPIINKVILDMPNCTKCNHSTAGHDPHTGCSFVGCGCRLDGDGQPCLVVEKLLSNKEVPGVFDPANGSPCPGHTCPVCSSIWYHDYTCGVDPSVKYYALCKPCAQQSAANINRPGNITQIEALESKHVLNNCDIVAKTLEHEAFVVLHLCKDKDGKDLPSDVWQENIAKHRLDLRKKIELLRACEMATSKVMAQRQMEDTIKLTPEEREAYERSARRNKVPKAAKSTVVDTAATSKKAYDQLLKDLLKQVKAKKPGLSEDEYIARANKKLAAMQDMEE